MAVLRNEEFELCSKVIKGVFLYFLMSMLSYVVVFSTTGLGQLTNIRKRLMTDCIEHQIMCSVCNLKGIVFSCFL